MRWNAAFNCQIFLKQVGDTDEYVVGTTWVFTAAVFKVSQ